MLAVRRRTTVAVALALVATFVACGDDDAGTSPGTNVGRDAGAGDAAAGGDAFGGDDGSTSDAGFDAGPACDLGAPFGNPTAIDSLDTPENAELWPRLTADELVIVFGTKRPPGEFGLHIATRASRTSPFGAPKYLDAVNAPPAFDADPMISADGLELYFQSMRNGTSDIFVATRATTTAEFSSPTPVAALNTGGNEYQPFFAATRKTFYVVREIGGRSQIFSAAVTNGTYGDAAPVTELASNANEWLPTPSADGLTIYFASNRAAVGTKGDYDIWVAKRATTSAPFDAPIVVNELSSPQADAPGFVSPDGCRLYFHSMRGGTAGDIYVAEKRPLP